MNTDKKTQMNTDKNIQRNADKGQAHLCQGYGGQAIRPCSLRLRSRQAGQAAIELAIFGSLILLALGIFVRYGLNANYSQRLKMDAYGKARAEMNSEAESTTYIVLRDKPIPNPTNPFGIASRDSVFFSSETVGRLSGVFDTPEYPSESELLTDPVLPRLIYDINGTAYQFTTAAFKYHPYDGQELKTKVHRNGTWYWKTSGPDRTDSNGVRYEHDEKMRPDGNFWKDLVYDDAQGKRADVDGDGEEELVLKIDGLTAYFSTYGLGMYGEVTGFYVMDYQEGQIDVSYQGPNEQRQGLQSFSRNNLELIDCSIHRKEDNNNIKSTTKTNWKQDIIRYIVVNPNYVKAAGLNEDDNIVAGLALNHKDVDGDGQADWYIDIKSDFSENKNLHWSAPHAN